MHTIGGAQCRSIKMSSLEFKQMYEGKKIDGDNDMGIAVRGYDFELVSCFVNSVIELLPKRISCKALAKFIDSIEPMDTIDVIPVRLANCTPSKSS